MRNFEYLVISSSAAALVAGLVTANRGGPDVLGDVSLVLLSYVVVFFVLWSADKILHWSKGQKENLFMDRGKESQNQVFAPAEWDELFEWFDDFRSRWQLTTRQFLEAFHCDDGYVEEFADLLYPSTRETVRRLNIVDVFTLLKKCKEDTEVDPKLQWFGNRTAGDVEKVLDRFYTHKAEFLLHGCVALGCKTFDEGRGQEVIVELDKEDRNVHVLEEKIRAELLRDVQASEFKFQFFVGGAFCNPSCVQHPGKWGTAFCFRPGWAITARHVFVMDNVPVAPLQCDWMIERDRVTKRHHSDSAVHQNVGVFEPHFSDVDMDLAFLRLIDVPSNVVPGKDTIFDRNLDWQRPLQNLYEGLRVYKHGVATGLTLGEVLPGDFGRFLMVKSLMKGPFAFYGDSGAVVFSAEGKVVGLVIASGEQERGGMVVKVAKYSAFRQMLRALPAPE